MKSISLRSSQRGFTLVELMIVVGIIAILTGIIVTSLTGSKAKSRDAQRVSDINQIQFALEQYFDRCGAYPDDIYNPSASCSASVNFGSYISKVPQDPSTRANYDYIVNDTFTDYVLHTTLEGRNQVQENSYPASVYNGLAWKTGAFSCYDPSNADSKDYCLSTR